MTLISEENAILLPQALRERLLTTVRQRLPKKSFGYILSDDAYNAPTDFILFEDNIRNAPLWKDKFESYGQYFIEHEDAGFVATPEESWRVQNEIWKRNMVEVGVFHSHLRHPANFSGVDFDLHTQRFDNLWHMIISLRNPDLPQLRIFAVTHEGVRELPVVTPNEGPLPEEQAVPVDELANNRVIAQARVLLELDKAGRPKYTDYKAIVTVIDGLLRTRKSEAIAELLTEGFLCHSAQRFAERIAPHLCHLEGGHFQMGTSYEKARHFCGETPCHSVNLSPFYIARIPVTNELFGLFSEQWLNVSASDRQKPATGITWFDATVFALWMGVRLPTEAEWEFACGARSDGEWCCEGESMLTRYAWYSENSQGAIQPVGMREPNAFGLYDLHGNVWEWCQDSYDQDYYASSPVVNPINTSSPFDSGSLSSVRHKVCKGGCLCSFSEMCRTRYRFHEPADFRAMDLGFRLAYSEAQKW